MSSGRRPRAPTTSSSELSAESAAFGLLHPVIPHHVVDTLQWPALRPLQADAVQPVLDGVCVFLAPTAGGKTEGAAFPLFSRMAGEGWTCTLGSPSTRPGLGAPQSCGTATPGRAHAVECSATGPTGC